MIDRRALIGAVSFAALMPRSAQAQAFPQRPPRLVIPFSAGGATDIIGRTLGNRLSEVWGQAVVVDNRTGAGGNIAAVDVARPAPDGHTLMIHAFPMVANRFLYASPGYELSDFSPLSMTCLMPNIMVVSPDVGGVVRARSLAKRIEAPLAIVDKRRDRPGESEVMNVIGDVRGKDCMLVDDIIDSGGTLCNAADALLHMGAASVTAYITHGVLSGGAVARITASKLKELVITNSIQPTSATETAHNIRVVSVAELMGEAIQRTALEKSVSSLFD